MGENIPAERQTAETKKETLKKLLKIEEMLALYSAITGKLTELFVNSYLRVLSKKKKQNGTFLFST